MGSVLMNKKERKMKEVRGEIKMENQEKGEVMKFDYYSPSETILFDQEGQRWIVRKTDSDRDADFRVSRYGWYKDHWSFYGSHDAYDVEVEGNVLRFQYKEKTDGLYYRMVWKEVILKEGEE
jgi:hypothetical protein